MQLFSDPFISTDTVEEFLYRFIDILHKETTRIHNSSNNPWNFMLYGLNSQVPTASIINLYFAYNTVDKKHTLIDTKVNSILDHIIDDMHRNPKYMTLFTCSYECNAGWDNETTGGAHSIMCGIIKKEKDVFIFILDPNGPQIERSPWWQKYFENLNKISSVQYFQNISRFKRVGHFFNTQIVETLKTLINKQYSMYNCTYDRKINLNPHQINMEGSEYQQGGYCLLISFFFIHILYNNIVIHNRL